MSAQQSDVIPQQNLPHLLVVDDDPVNLQLTQRILEPQYNVTSVDNGTDALALLARESFDLVLLDIMMPDINGLEVLQIIRQTEALANMPVILVSVLSDARDIVRGLQLGASDYISKPFDINEALARVSTHVKLKRLLDERNDTISDLEATRRMRDNLFRVASHDLKAPLTNIRMSEYILRDIVGNHPDGQRVLDTMLMTVEHMHEVITEFLDMAACQSGKVEIHLECIETERLLWDIVAQYHLTAQKKNIRLEVTQVGGSVMADRGRLGQVIGNLVSNAIKYSPPQTTVTLCSEVINERVRLRVIDQGPGIPANERDQLFKEFAKLSTRPTANEASTGLGLWIAHHLIMLQGGSIDVDSPPDGGSVFWVELPSCQA